VAYYPLTATAIWWLCLVGLARGTWPPQRHTHWV